MRAPRIGLVGARRRRLGLGPFVARFLRDAGAELPCFLSTSAASRDETAESLERSLGLRARGYLSLAEMLDAEALEALAILAPAGTHEGFLAAAAEAGLHALCEKPLVWGGGDLAARGARRVEGFSQRGLSLWENCQWPYTLPAWDALHRGARSRPPRRIRVELEPGVRGREMLGDSLPHVLSLVQACCGEVLDLGEVAFPAGTADPTRLDLRFRVRSAEGDTTVDAILCWRATQPRRAGYAIDGREARRVVSREGYRLSFQGDGRSVPLPDPLERLLADFVRDLARPERSRRRRRAREIARRMGLLDRLVRAYDEQTGETG